MRSLAASAPSAFAPSLARSSRGGRSVVCAHATPARITTTVPYTSATATASAAPSAAAAAAAAATAARVLLARAVSMHIVAARPPPRRKGGPGATERRAASQQLPRDAVEAASPARRRWAERQRRDRFVAGAAAEGLRSRAAFKLRGLLGKGAGRGVLPLRRGARVVDLGAAPGGWTQVAAEAVHQHRSGGSPASAPAVVAVDVIDMAPVPGAIFVQGDFTRPAVRRDVRAALRGGEADVVLSDMAPSASGDSRLDHDRLMDLAATALSFARKVLAPGGCLLVKVSFGGGEAAFRDRLRRSFDTVAFVKPEASRKDSAEVYLLAKGFKGRLQPPAAPPPEDRTEE